MHADFLNPSIMVIIYCARPHKVSPTIMLLGEFDWQPYVVDMVATGTSRCTDMVSGAPQSGWDGGSV